MDIPSGISYLYIFIYMDNIIDHYIPIIYIILFIYIPIMIKMILGIFHIDSPIG